MYHVRRKCTLSSLPVISHGQYTNKSARLLSTRTSVDISEQSGKQMPIQNPLIYAYEKSANKRNAIHSSHNPSINLHYNGKNSHNFEITSNRCDIILTVEPKRGVSLSHTLANTPTSAQNNTHLVPPQPKYKASQFMRNSLNKGNSTPGTSSTKDNRRSFETPQIPVIHKKLMMLQTPSESGYLKRIQFLSRPLMSKQPIIIIHLEGVLLGKVITISNLLVLKHKTSTELIRSSNNVK